MYTDIEDVETIARKFDESFHEVVEKMLMMSIKFVDDLVFLLMMSMKMLLMIKFSC